MEYFEVKNFSKFQHYKDRSPTWIKYYCSVIDDDEINLLPENTQNHLKNIWCLASRRKNKLPFDKVAIGVLIQAKSEVNLDLLVDKGYLKIVNDSVDASTDDSIDELALEEKRREENIKKKIKEERTKRLCDFFDNQLWIKYPKRHGKRIGKKKSKEIFLKKVKIDDFDSILLALKNYIFYLDKSDQYAKDCERWLLVWTDWMEEIKEDVPGWLLRQRERDKQNG